MSKSRRRIIAGLAADLRLFGLVLRHPRWHAGIVREHGWRGFAQSVGLSRRLERDPGWRAHRRAVRNGTARYTEIPEDMTNAEWIEAVREGRL